MTGRAKLACAVAAAVILLFAVRAVWLSGFDQGAAVALCTVASVQNGGRLATAQPACRDAEAYKRSPLWALRRRG